MTVTFYVLSGSAEVGKDTCADYLLEKLKCKHKKIIKIGLADQLKVVCQQLIKLFYGIEFPLDYFYNRNQKELIRTEMPLFNNKPFSIRSVLQYVGTDVIRTYLFDDIWCKYIEYTYVKPQTGETSVDAIIISDARFINEVAYFKDKQDIITKVIKIQRDCVGLQGSNGQHISETQSQLLPDQYIDFIIDNNSSLQNLYEQLDKVISDN